MQSTVVPRANWLPKLQAGLSGIIGETFREMIKDRTFAALESRAKDKRPTGGRAYGYRDGDVDRGEAFILQEIFGRYADGASTRTITADLNTRRIASPGSNWKRETRRANGWAGALPRRDPLEHERLAQGPGQWQAPAQHSIEIGMDPTLGQIAEDHLRSALGARTATDARPADGGRSGGEPRLATAGVLDRVAPAPNVRYSTYLSAHGLSAAYRTYTSHIKAEAASLGESIDVRSPE